MRQIKTRWVFCVWGVCALVIACTAEDSDLLNPPDDGPDYITGVQDGCLAAGGVFDEETQACLPDDGPDYITGVQDGCLAAGGVFDEETQACLPAPPAPEPAQWLMVQDAEAVTFEFDDEVSEECPEEAFWSGVMTMTGADPVTLWFTDRPDRLAYTRPTDEFVDGFEQTFSEATGGYPNAVLNWREPDSLRRVTWWDVDGEIPVPGEERHIVVELTSPAYSEEDATLTYGVCGLRLDDPATLEPLPDAEQYQPEEAPTSGDFALFIDSVTRPFCGVSEKDTDCFMWGFCGSDGWNGGSCGVTGLSSALKFVPSTWCEYQYAAGVSSAGSCSALIVDRFVLCMGR